MPYGRYISECTRQLLALDIELEPDDVEALRSRCVLMNWPAWTDEHQEEISLFVAGDGAHRRKVKILEPDNHRLLVLAALQRVTTAKAMLTVLMAHHLEPKGKAQELIARAGTAFWEMFLEKPAEWPFDGVSPFLDESFQLLYKLRCSDSE